MCRKLGLVKHAIYSETHNKFFDCVDGELLSEIECDHDEEPGEIIEVKCYPVLLYQYWFPHIKYLERLLKENKEPPTIDNIIDDIICITDLSYDDHDDEEALPELNGVDEFISELNYYWEVTKAGNEPVDNERIQKALTTFEDANKHVTYWVAANSKEYFFTIHLFKVLENHDIEYIGIKETIESEVK